MVEVKVRSNQVTSSVRKKNLNSAKFSQRVFEETLKTRNYETMEKAQRLQGKNMSLVQTPLPLKKKSNSESNNNTRRNNSTTSDNYRYTQNNMHAIRDSSSKNEESIPFQVLQGKNAQDEKITEESLSTQNQRIPVHMVCFFNRDLKSNEVNVEAPVYVENQYSYQADNNNNIGVSKSRLKNQKQFGGSLCESYDDENSILKRTLTKSTILQNNYSQHNSDSKEIKDGEKNPDFYSSKLETLRRFSGSFCDSLNDANSMIKKTLRRNSLNYEGSILSENNYSYQTPKTIEISDLAVNPELNSSKVKSLRRFSGSFYDSFNDANSMMKKTLRRNSLNYNGNTSGKNYTYQVPTNIQAKNIGRNSEITSSELKFQRRFSGSFCESLNDSNSILIKTLKRNSLNHYCGNKSKKNYSHHNTNTPQINDLPKNSELNYLKSDSSGRFSGNVSDGFNDDNSMMKKTLGKNSLISNENKFENNFSYQSPNTIDIKDAVRNSLFNSPELKPQRRLSGSFYESFNDANSILIKTLKRNSLTHSGYGAENIYFHENSLHRNIKNSAGNSELVSPNLKTQSKFSGSFNESFEDENSARKKNGRGFSLNPKRHEPVNQYSHHELNFAEMNKLNMKTKERYTGRACPRLSKEDITDDNNSMMRKTLGMNSKKNQGNTEYDHGKAANFGIVTNGNMSRRWSDERKKEISPEQYNRRGSNEGQTHLKDVGYERKLDKFRSNINISRRRQADSNSIDAKRDNSQSKNEKKSKETNYNAGKYANASSKNVEIKSKEQRFNGFVKNIGSLKQKIGRHTFKKEKRKIGKENSKSLLGNIYDTSSKFDEARYIKRKRAIQESCKHRDSHAKDKVSKMSATNINKDINNISSTLRNTDTCPDLVPGVYPEDMEYKILFKMKEIALTKGEEGDWEESYLILKKILKFFEAKNGKADEIEANLLLNLGIALLALNKYDSALKVLESSTNILNTSSEKNHKADLALAWWTATIIYRDKRNLKQALECLNTVKNIESKILGKPASETSRMIKELEAQKKQDYYVSGISV